MKSFRDFLKNEQVGLADLGANIDRVFASQTSEPRAGAYVSDQFDNKEPVDGSADHAPWLPSDEILIPQVEKTGRIVILLKNRNPIYVKLSDGTEASFTYEEFKRIEGKPEVGKTMTVIFQRHPEDATDRHSKIEKAFVR